MSLDPVDGRQPPHVVSLVLNGVLGDSRVIKTAQAAVNAGFRATIVGLGNEGATATQEVHGVSVVLVGNPVYAMKKEGLWPSDRDKRSLWLYVEHALQVMLPVIVDLRPDLLHSHDMMGLRVGAETARHLAARGHVIPWIHDIHEFVRGLTTVPTDYRETCSEYERRYLRQADALITVSEALSETVSTHYKLRNSPIVVLNSTHHTEFQGDGRDIRSAIGLAPTAPLVVYVGVVKSERGCETIVQALKLLPDVNLCFISNNEKYVNLLRTLGESIGVGNRMFSHAYVPIDEVTTFVRTADVGIHPLTHYPNAEVAMPNKLFEYLQAGIPIAVSDVVEMKRFIEATGIGETFQPGSPESCAAAIGKILADPQCYRSRITRDLQRSLSWQAQEEKLVALYDSLLRRPKVGRTLHVLSELSNVSPMAMRQIVETDPTAPMAWVGPTEPPVPVDVFIDPSDVHAPGLLSQVAARFDRIHVYGRSVWPTELDLLSLKSPGRTIRIDNPSDVPAELQSLLDSDANDIPHDAWMRAVELAYLQMSERLQNREIQYRRLRATATRVEGPTPPRHRVEKQPHPAPASAPALEISEPRPRKRLFSPPLRKIPFRILRRIAGTP